MALRFRPWEPTARFGKPHEAVEAFTARTAQIALRMPAPATDIWFEVVDIRPTAEDPSLVIEKVTKLFLEPRFIRASIAPNSRLLFAGAARSLAEWEPESELRSVNSDIELFIRALQSLDVGHYVCVDPDAGRTEDAIGHGWITSALFAFQRFYAKKENREADAADRLTQLSGDVIKLFVSARARKGFERLGIPGSYKGAGDPQDDTLLNEIRLLYQLGKRDRLSEHGAEREFERGRIEETVELDLPSASYDLLGSIESKVMPWAEKYKLVSKRLHPMGAIGDAKAAQWLAGATFKMKRYEMLRDLGRLIGSNAVAQLRQQIEKARKARRGGGPLFLIMDDFIYYYLIGLSPRAEEEEDETNLIIAAIKRVFEAVDCKAGDFLVIPTMAMPVEGDTLGGEAHLSIFRDTDMKPVTLDGKPAAAPQSPESYVAILMDPEAASDALGPVRVQRMANYLRQVPQRTAGRRGREGKGVRVPSIIAFSQRESSGHVQQCLNLGAAAFTAKHRPYHLLFDLNRVLREAAPGRPSTDRASQFRILRTLKPHTGVKLHRGEGPAFLHGGLYCPEERDRHRLDDFLDDPREETWLRSLPKADLHCHIGTCIDYATIELMALNSVGYMLGSGRLGTVPDGSLKAAAHGVGALLDTAARIVSLADALKPKEGDRPGTGSNAPPLIRLAAAAAVTVVDRDSPLQPQAFGLGDAIIARLRRIDERCALFQVAAVLVATISLHPRRDDGAAPYGAAGGPLDYLDALAKQASRPSAGKPRSRAAFSLGSALDHSLRRAMNRLEEIAHRWDGRFTEGQIRDAIGKGRPPKQLRGLIEALRARTDRAEQVLKASFKKARGLEEDNPEQFEQERNAALEWLKAQGCDGEATPPADPDAHPLEAYVLAARAPEQDGGRSGLQLYLQGADLLGSAHLQYPDNLLLATYAITRENVADNVIYSEVRCETTGYTRAGMSAIDATEMLRHGFNLASLFLAGQPARGGKRRWPLVRTNILLAAKRHKEEEEARKVVALLESYLERRPGDVERSLSRLRFPQPFPPWWRPSDVVGFDLSGDESKDKEWLAAVIKPLTTRSSPITIHAGEASDAQSIWRAVYGLNATRIGHGLRLAEDQALLGYCVREGICMEMCPNSNAATNGFRCIPALDRSPYPLLQYEYPLLQYMRAGMEVTLGTDNRYLHPPNRRDLTSEYVAAARLVGGLTRWEVLQIVKAGFKNAFLEKVEISEMLGAIEEKVYGIVAADAP